MIYFTLLKLLDNERRRNKEKLSTILETLTLKTLYIIIFYSQGKPKILRLHSLLGDKETKKNSPQQQQQQLQKNNSGIKRRREMGEVEKEKFDEERQRVIDAYRLAKKRREMKSS